MRTSCYEKMIGEKHHMLLPIKITKTYMPHRKNYHYKLVCKCDCGKLKTVDAATVKSGRVTSCGCRRDQYLKNTGENSKQFTGYKDIAGATWATIKRRAKNRNISFKLKIKDVWNLLVAQDHKCALSGVPIKFGMGSKNRATTASIDRKDSSKGYTMDNIQLVHKTINLMKNVLSDEEFKQWCTRVAFN